MRKLFTIIEQANPAHLFWLIVGASIVLAAQMQAIQHNWINPDSVLYLEAAKLIVIGDFQGAYQVFNWPLYAFCIGVVSKLTGFGVHLSAQLLNMLFFGIATASFLRIIQLAGGSNLTIFSGALLLFGNLYIVGDVLEMLMRDEGFWAFYLASLVFFIRYTQQYKQTDAVLWQLCIIVATLFRIEGILFLFLLPLTCLFTRKLSVKEKIQQLFNTYSISLITGFIIVIAITTLSQLDAGHLGRLNEIFTSNLYHELTRKFVAQADIMSTQVLGGYLEEFAIPGLLLTFVYVLGSKTLTAAGLIGTGLALLEIRSTSTQIPSAVRRVLLTAAAIALIAMALIIIKVFVLSSRYAIAFAWILMLFASFYLSSMMTKSDRKSRVLLTAICLILSLCLIKNILPKRDGYNYSQEAVTWIKTLNKSKEPVFYNETRMRYYANEAFIGTWADNTQMLINAINNKTINQYRYLLIDSSAKEASQLTTITKRIPQFKHIKTFNSTRQKKYVLIFKRD